MNLKKYSTIKKLAIDFYSMQMKWTLWYLVVVLAITFIALFFISDINSIERGFIEIIFGASKIYLAVVGIFICFSMLGFMVKNGITRKDYFYGTAIAAVGVTFSILIIASIISHVIELSGFDYLTEDVSFLGATSNWFIPILSLSLILLSYYIAGWIIAVGYYRFGGLKTIGFVAIAISYVSLIDLLWEGGFDYQFNSSLIFSTSNIPISYSFAITLILIGLALWLVRLITKRIPIKIE